ncbi:MAG: DUF3333 domain-containing protein, partial [Alphaproteobacteria bacterium]
MTDTPPSTASNRPPTADLVARSLKRRRRKQSRLVWLGLGSVSLAFLMLFILVASIASTGWPAFTQTLVTLEVHVDPAKVKAEKLPRGKFDDVLLAALGELLPGVDLSDRATRKEVKGILSSGAKFKLRDMVVADPGLIGQTVTLKVPVSDPYDQLYKGLIDRTTPEANRRLTDAEIAYFDKLVAAGIVSKPINWALLTEADSRFPELAGLKGAIMGSFWALLTTFLISFPLGIGAGIYLEEFAPKNRIS